MKLWQKIKAHRVVLSIAFVVGALTVAPAILAPLALGHGYQGYPFIYQANEDAYMARAQTIINGHPLVGALLHEYQDMWPPILPITEQLYAVPTILFSIPLAYTVLFFKFLFPALLFLLIYAVVRALVGREHPLSHLGSIATGLLVVLGYDLIDYAHILPLLFGSTDQTTLILWARTVNPISGALLLFSVLLIIINICRVQTRYLFILGGVLLGLTIGYFFSWFLSAALTGLAMLWMLYSREFTRARQLLYMLCISIVVQSPYWFNSFFASDSNARHASQLKNGAIFTHAPIFNKFILAALAAYIILLSWQYWRTSSFKLEPLWRMSGGVLLACLIAYTQQIITGVTIWPYHFVQYTVPLAVVAVLALATYAIAPAYPRIWRTVLIAIIFISLWVGLASLNTYRFALSDYAVRQSYMPLFYWLNKNAEAGCVVLVDEPVEKLAMLVPAFTKCTTYISTYIAFNVPDDRIMHNFLVQLRLHGVQPQNVRDYLQAHPQEVNGYFYSSIDQSLAIGANAETQADIERIVPAYQNFYKESFADQLKKYRIDYLLTTGTSTLPNIPLVKETQSGALTLYTVQ